MGNESSSENKDKLILDTELTDENEKANGSPQKDSISIKEENPNSNINEYTGDNEVMHLPSRKLAVLSSSCEMIDKLHTELQDVSNFNGKDCYSKLPATYGPVVGPYTYRRFENSGVVVYKGTMINDKREGYGVAILTNHKGTLYAGCWLKDQMHGQGALLMYKGSWYKGNFDNNNFSGYGELYDTINKTLYHGDFEKGSKSGNGKETSLADKTQYEGEFYNNLRHGKGNLTFDNKDVYKGEFNNDLMEGIGKLAFNNGDVYKGSFLNNLMSGDNCLYVFGNGDSFKGSFRYGKKHGEGTIKTKSGQLKSGFWDLGVFTENVKRIVTEPSFDDHKMTKAEFDHILNST